MPNQEFACFLEFRFALSENQQIFTETLSYSAYLLIACGEFRSMSIEPIQLPLNSCKTKFGMREQLAFNKLECVL